MIPSDREWRGVAGATSEALERLQAASPIELPSAYLELLAFSNGGEGPLAIQPLYFQLDPADDAAEAMRSRSHEEFFPGFLVVGSNGGGEYIALDVRGSAPWPVVAIDMTNGDLDESVQAIAVSFDSFVEMIGVESGE